MDRGKTRVITLTGRAPVRIQEDAWPTIASSRRHDGQVESQANRVWHLTVRRHADGRTIVYGSEREGDGGCHRGYEPATAGELLESGADVAGAIARVARDARCSQAMRDECIAELPAVNLA